MIVQLPHLFVMLNAYTQRKSGGVAAAAEIIKRLPEVKVSIITSSLGEQFCRGKGIRADYRRTTREKKIGNILLLYGRRLVRALFLPLRPKRGDIFLVTSDFLPDTLPVWWRKTLGQKIFWTQHIFHFIPPQRKISFLMQRISLALIRQRADLIFVDNRILKDELIGRGFLPLKIVVNYLGVDHRFFKTAPGKRPKIFYQGVFIGRLHPSKGIFNLIKIWAVVVKKLPQAKLIMVGHGEEEIVMRLKREISRRGLQKNIILAGFLPDQKVVEVLSRGEIFVSPSLEEGFGLAILEAQAVGKPVVAWDLPVFKEIFPRGLIRVPLGQNKAFAAALIALLTKKKYYQKVAFEAKKNSLDYSWGKTARREWQKILAAKNENKTSV